MSQPLSPSLYQDERAREKGRVVGQTCKSLLDTTSLRTEAQVDAAIVKLDHALADLPVSNTHEFVSVLESIPHLLEFILCVAGEYSFSLLAKAFLEKDYTAKEFLDTIAPKLLDRLSFSLNRAFSEGGASSLRSVITDWQAVEHALGVLKTLSLMSDSDMLAEGVDDVPLPRRAAKRREEQTRVRSKTMTHRTGVDVKALLEYGEEVPSTKQQVERLATKVIDEQMKILEEYLNAFRQLEVKSYFRDLYLPHLVRPDDIPEASAVSSGFQEEGSSQRSRTLGLFFDTVDRFGEWHISISTRAERDLRRARREDGKFFKIVANKIKDLSHGHFTQENHNLVIGADVGIPIYETKMTTPYSSLLYHIHCDFDPEKNVDRQVIRIFGIYSRDKMNKKFWAAVSKQLDCRGSQYKQRCLYREGHVDRALGVHPGEFPTSEDQHEPKALSSSSEGLTTQDVEELHKLLTLEKFITFSKEFLKSVLADQDVAHVFDLSRREHEILAHESSCFVIGRSGTGKTTTMLFKMLSNERSWNDVFHGSMSKPRQLFVTQSHVLAKKVAEYYGKLDQSFATAHLSPSELKKLTIARNESEDRDMMVDSEEEARRNSTLPSRYGALKDEDFPMFLTFDRLCRLLEGEFRSMVIDNRISKAKAGSLADILRLRRKADGTYSSGRLQEDDAFVDYDKFVQYYWSRFGDSSWGLGPEMVFSEIIGIIKGSEEALKRPDGYLDAETYTALRTYVTSALQRERIYGLFKQYTQMRTERFEYDAADRTRMLIHCLEVSSPERPLSFIYVDEVQDNLMIDAMLLRKLCSNPHGMLWAGDTAQTISAGSAFQFTELGALMYRMSSLDASTSLAGKREHSETFYLPINYRSHSGITNCACSVVELITTYWPKAIDNLPRESASTAGPKPKFFREQDGQALQKALFRDSDGGKSIDFGCNQCIIVRNDTARKRLRQEVESNIGQIFTVYESKGLEFNDVLLYNFFEDSAVDPLIWHRLMVDVTGHNDPTLQDGRFAGICREFKHLYVAMTRARMNLWIVDCSWTASPLLKHWQEQGLVDVHPTGAPLPQLAVSSGKQEWAAAARSLFGKRQFAEAMLAFDRAGLEHDRDVAEAYLIRAQARHTPVISRSGPTQAMEFARAAAAFLRIVQGATPREQKEYYRIAGDCWDSNGDHRRAGSAYLAAGEYTAAAKQYRAAGRFDEAVSIVKAHQEEVSPEVGQSIIDVSRLHYIKENQVFNVATLFEDVEEALEYMDDYGFDAPRATLLEKLGRIADAAESRLTEGDTVSAIRMFIRDHSPASTSRAVDCLLQGLWGCLSLCTPEENWDNPLILDLLGCAETLHQQWVHPDARAQLRMFSAVFSDDVAVLDRLGTAFLEQDRMAAALLCLDQVYGHPYEIDADLVKIVEASRVFLHFVRGLQRLVCDPVPCSNTEIQTLLAFRPRNEEMFHVSPLSRLYAMCTTKSLPEPQHTRDGLLVPRWALERHVREILRECLKKHVRYRTEQMHISECLRPCLAFAVDGSCRKNECKKPHVTTYEDCTRIYNRLVQIYMIQIMIFHTLYATDEKFIVLAKQQRAWLRRLYEALYPLHPNLGSLHRLSPQLVTELRSCRGIIRVWLQDFLNRLQPYDEPPKVFLNNMARATDMAMLFDRHAAQQTMQLVPCLNLRSQKPHNLLRFIPGKGDHYVVHDLVAMVRCNYSGAVDKGVRFLNHILAHRVPIDVGVLCDYMDYLCAAMLTAMRFKNARNLHGLTLPRSWWMKISVNLDQLSSMNTSQARSYMMNMAGVLEAVYTGENASQFLLHSTDLSSAPEPNIPKLSTMARITIFQRICLNLCLWAYNYHDVSVNQRVMWMITSLKRKHTSHYAMRAAAERYYAANSVDTVLVKMFQNGPVSCGDELLQLRYASWPVHTPVTLTPCTRQIQYSRNKDIAGLVGALHIMSLSAADDADWATFVDPRRTHVESDDLPQGTVLQSTPDVELAVEGEESDDETQVDVLGEQSMEEQNVAATRIATAYRKYAARKAVQKDTLVETLRRHFTHYLEKSDEMSWSRVSYRWMFCRAVPRLLAAVEYAKDRMYAGKAAAKANLHKAKHQDYEHVENELKEASRLFKDACRLHKGLVPIAPIHTTCDMDMLVQRADEVDLLLQNIESNLGGVPWDCRIAVDMARRLIICAS